MRTMRKPLTRHNAASLTEFAYYAAGVPMRQLCRLLQRHERTIKRWSNGESVIPPWAVAVLRLRHLERELIKDQMGINEFFREERRRERAPAIERRPPANDQHYAVQLKLDMGGAH